MRKRDVNVDVSDHAILRFLEREHGIDVEAIRRHIRGLAMTGAQLSAVSVAVGRVKLVLRERICRGGARRPGPRWRWRCYCPEAQ